MSILNRPSDGLLSVVIVLCKCLLEHKELPEKQLINMCAPLSITDQRQARQTLKTWKELGLFSAKDDNICISKKISHDDKSIEKLPKCIRKLVLADENNKNLWGSEGSKSADFTRAVSWMLAQDVYKIPGSSYSSIESIEVSQFTGEKRILQNDTRWVGFKQWAVYLGFGWRTLKDTFIVDPTIAIREVLPDVFAKSTELTQAQFFKSLASLLPVVDGGSYRKMVEEKLSRNHWREPKEDEVSTSLSRALDRLKIEGYLSLESRADAPQQKWLLLGAGGEKKQRVSHVILQKA